MDSETKVEKAEDDDSWEDVELVSGRLVRVSKARLEITIEVEELDHNHRPILVPHAYSISAEMPQNDLDELRELIGVDVEAEIHDGEVVWVSRNLGG